MFNTLLLGNGTGRIRTVELPLSPEVKGELRDVDKGRYVSKAI